MRAVLFILLKVAEIALFIFAPYLVGSILYKIINQEPSLFETWLFGLGIIGLTVLFAIIIFGVIGLNLILSEYISEKLKK